MGERHAADTMRRAATLMRDRANAVDVLGELAETIADVPCDEFAEFIASWDPPVARLVADMLDEAAEETDGVERIYAKILHRERPQWARGSTALTLARAYLNEAAE